MLENYKAHSNFWGVHSNFSTGRSNFSVCSVVLYTNGVVLQLELRSKTKIGCSIT